MSRIQKLINQLKSCPVEMRPDQIDKILTHYGFECRQPGTSHRTYSHPKMTSILTIPWTRPIKRIYIKKVIEAIELLEDSIDG